jgi:hypothetical protein
MFRLTQISFLFIFTFSSLAYGSENGHTHKEKSHEIEPPLCGVNSLYLALRLLSIDAKPDYEKLLSFFPNARSEGISLEQLSQYFDKRQIPWQYARLGKEELKQLSEKAILFVLTKSKNNAHLYLMRRNGPERWQAIDAPSNFVDIKGSDIEKISLDCLVVAKEKGDLLKNKKPSAALVSTVLGLAWVGFLLLVFRGKKAKLTMEIALFLILLSTSGTLSTFAAEAKLTKQKKEGGMVTPQSEQPLLACSQTSFDFGLITPKDGFASGQHVFVIKNISNEAIKIRDIVPSCPSCITVNSLKEIPAKSSAKLKVAFRLEAKTPYRYDTEIYVIPEDKKVKCLRLTISAFIGFSAYSTPEKLGFTEAFYDETSTRFVEIFCSTQSRFEKLIKEVRFSHPEIFQLKVVEEIREARKLDERVAFNLYRNKLEIGFNGKSGKTKETSTGKLQLLLNDGTSLNIPINWDLKKRPVFEPATFFLFGLQPSTEREFSATYDLSLGGSPKSIKASSANLTLLKNEIKGKKMIFLLKFLAPEKIETGQILGEVVIETTEGKKHTLPVIAP